jgi:hypothetical protein
MTQEYVSIALSKEAFADLKKVAVEELDDTMSDGEIDEMGSRLLSLFSVLTSETKPAQRTMVGLSEQESKALAFIREKVEREGKMPSVRELAKALGFRSSRSRWTPKAGCEHPRNNAAPSWRSLSAAGCLVLGLQS